MSSGGRVTGRDLWNRGMEEGRDTESAGYGSGICGREKSVRCRCRDNEKL